ncbi:MAG: transposase [Clostridiales bacterium]|nr:transposase [Clostridiales bacterium]
MLEYKTRCYGSELKTVPRFYPSSKTCSTCGYVLEKLELSTRYWQCPQCAKYHDRDINAAINLLKYYLAA